ncbi:MAG: response regulator [Nitrososphaeraceae archaeon]
MFTHHDSLPTTTLSNRQETLTQNGKEVQQELSPKSKRVLIVDDDPDITLTFKKGLEAENEKSSNLFFEVSTYNDPINALSEFKPNLYDLLLVDINMPKMDGLEFSAKILEQDINVRVCFITATEINTRALREQYSSLSIGCFIKKPVTIENLVERVKAELN